MTGIIGLAFANAFLSGHFGPWMNGPGRAVPCRRCGLGPRFCALPGSFSLCASAWLRWPVGAYLERAPWGRIVAIVAAILSILKFPFGTAMGIWTLIVLLGYRNSTLYEQLP